MQKIKKTLNVKKILSVNMSGNDTYLGWGVYDGASRQWITQASHFILGMSQLRNDFFFQEVETIRNTVKDSYSNLSILCCVIGPGSFTGLRLGLSFLKGISGVYDIPIIGIKTHELWAYSYRGVKYPLLIVHNSRKGRAYVATYYNKDSFKCDPFVVDFHPHYLSEIKEMTFEEISAQLPFYKKEYDSPVVCVGTALYNTYTYIKQHHKMSIKKYITFMPAPLPQLDIELLALGLLCFDRKSHILDEYAEPFYVKAEV